MNKLFLFFIFNSKDCFYYPQRFLIGIFLSTFALLYCIFWLVDLILKILTQIKIIQIYVTDNIFIFLNGMMQSIKTLIGF